MPIPGGEERQKERSGTAVPDRDLVPGLCDGKTGDRRLPTEDDHGQQRSVHRPVRTTPAGRDATPRRREPVPATHGAIPRELGRRKRDSFRCSEVVFTRPVERAPAEHTGPDGRHSTTRIRRSCSTGHAAETCRIRPENKRTGDRSAPGTCRPGERRAAFARGPRNRSAARPDPEPGTRHTGEWIDPG